MATSSGQARRQQAGVVPYRESPAGLEFCLITTDGGGWGFPKGFIERDETCPEAALKEAFEEAGLHGELIGEPLGSYAYKKRGLNLEVTVYLMQVKQCDDDWMEAGSRSRRWVSAEQADEALVWEQVRRLLQTACGRLKRDGIATESPDVDNTNS